jgi:uncharacterized protein (DUF1330 family)
MPAYVAVDITIHDPETYDRYKAMAPPSIVKYGGTYVVRGGSTTTLEGEWSPKRFVLLQFKDAATARAWWESPEYAPAKALRQSCATTQMLLVDGPAFDPSKA